MTTSAARRRVWIVDDSPLEVEMGRRALADHYDVAVFTDGSSVLEAITHQPPPDVMVLDWNMPGVSGIEVCQFLRANRATAELSVLLLTGYQSTDDIVRGLSAGANDYVVKPFAAAELVARVGALVRSRELRERAEVAERNMAELMEQLPDAVVTIDKNGVIAYANSAAQSVFTLERQQLVGRGLFELLPGHDGTLSALAKNDAPSTRDIHIGERIYSPAVRPLQLLNGQAGFTFALRDVTEKRAHDARRLDFYSIIAHDLRSPLGAMLMRTELLLNGARGPLPTALQDDLVKMKARINDQVEMINDFLELAQLDGTGLKIDSAPFDLSELAAHVVEEFAPTSEAAKVRLSTSGAGVLVMGDRRRLLQVFNNLVSNAIKFTPANGVVDVTVAASANGAHVAVKDTGRGISPMAIAGLFKRYVRVDESRATTGTGLGLMIVREIVEAHGGTVGADSVPGQGSTFWFQLPSSFSAPSP